jgi:hypothetical protein
MAVNFAKLPELLRRGIKAPDEVPASPQSVRHRVVLLWRGEYVVLFHK